MKLHVAIQHHPSRAALIPELVERLGGAEVVTDPDPEAKLPSALRTNLECIRRCPDDVTHLLVVQDDAWPCDDFRARAEPKIEEKPEAMIAFFMPGVGEHRRLMMRAHAAGEGWTRLPITWAPTVALCWPVDRAREFLAFAEERYDLTKQKGDDGPVGKYRERHKTEAWAVVPSLVQHPDVVPSLMGRTAAGHGRNRARLAAVYEG